LKGLQTDEKASDPEHTHDEGGNSHQDRIPDQMLFHLFVLL
jgi:hypothetical protein